MSFLFVSMSAAAHERQKIVNKALQLGEPPSQNISSAFTMNAIVDEPYDEKKHAQGWRTIKHMKCMSVVPITTSGREKAGILRTFSPALDGDHEKCVALGCGLAAGSVLLADCGDRNTALRNNPPIYRQEEPTQLPLF